MGVGAFRGGSEVALNQAITALGAWLGWTTTLLFAEWWLQYHKPAKVKKAERHLSAVA